MGERWEKISRESSVHRWTIRYDYRVAASFTDKAMILVSFFAKRIQQNATDVPVKAVLPEGFHDLDFKAGKIEASSSWWQKR